MKVVNNAKLINKLNIKSIVKDKICRNYHIDILSKGLSLLFLL